MSIVERILRVFLSYAELAQGWNPQEEGDYQDFVDAVGNALAPVEQCGRVDEGMVDRMIEEYRRLEPEDSKLMEISTTDGETRDFCRSLLQAALAQNAQRGAVADRPAGFGIACTVTWTELFDAMTADGMSPPNKCGPATRKWVERVVRDYLNHPPAQAAQVEHQCRSCMAKDYGLQTTAEPVAHGETPSPSDADLLHIFSDEIGFKADDIQQVNAEDLLRISRAVLAAQPRAVPDGVRTGSKGRFITDQGYVFCVEVADVLLSIRKEDGEFVIIDRDEFITESEYVLAAATQPGESA
jgi:hypothetical protein